MRARKNTLKDCFIIDTMPSFQDASLHLRQPVSNFSQTCYHTTPLNLKARHLHGNWRVFNQPPGVFVNFSYSGAKTQICNGRPRLSGQTNTINCENDLNERIPEMQLYLKRQAEKFNLKVTTN